MSSGMCVGYLVNIYPKGSHTFIRREILELERQGVAVERFALRGWDSNPVDPIDRDELAKTHHTMRNGLAPLFLLTIRFAVLRPRLFMRGLGIALSMSRSSGRSVPYHLIYLAHAVCILNWLKGSNVSHIHAHFGTNSAEIAALIHKLGGPTYSFIVHGAEVLDNPAHHALPVKVEGAKFVLGSCSYAASQIMYHVDPSHWSRIKTVHCGLPSAAFEGPVTPLPEAPVFLCISRFSPEKAHILILRAFAAVVKSHPKARLLLVGDGPMEPQMRALAAELGIAEALVFEGWLASDAVQAKIREASALVHPSFAEGLPVVIMEAMTERRPVISTYIAGIPELVKDQETGWLIPAGDENALVQAMMDCAARPKQDLERMGSAGFERVRTRHDIRSEVEKLMVLFSSEHVS